MARWLGVSVPPTCDSAGSSNRFWQITENLAWIASRINALESYFGATARTQFKLHDLIDHSEYDLITDPAQLPWTPTSEWYTTGNRQSLAQLIVSQFATGGPNKQGAHRAYTHELIDEFRNAIDRLWPIIWNVPPLGPGKTGMIFQSGLYLRDVFVNQKLGPDVLGNVNGTYPEHPNFPKVIDASTWDHVTDPVPIAEYYLPIDRLDVDTDLSWNAGYFNAIPYREGTRAKANDSVCAEQVLCELAAHTVLPLKWRDVYLGIGANVLDGQDPGIIMPPGGDPLTGLTVYNTWGARGEKINSFPDNYTRWTVNDLVPFPSQSHRVTNQFNKMAVTRQRRLMRLGFERDIMGIPFLGTYFDAIALQLQAEPDKVELEFTAHWAFKHQGHKFPPDGAPLGVFPHTIQWNASSGIGQFADDNTAIRSGATGMTLHILPAIIQTVGPGDTVNDGGQQSFSFDLTTLLKGWRFDKAVYMWVTVSPSWLAAATAGDPSVNPVEIEFTFHEYSYNWQNIATYATFNGHRVRMPGYFAFPV